MGRKRKKIKENEGFKVETAKDPIDVDSPEVIAAVETFNEEQSNAIADLMDDADDHGLPSIDRTDIDEGKPDDQTPSDEPAESKEQDSQPEAQESEKETEAKVEEQPPAEATPEAEASVPESDEQPKEEEPQFVSGEHFGDYSVEVVTEDGAKQVPLSNLVTTYQQFPNIQRKYQDLKPIMDLAESAQVDISQVLPLLEIGIQTYTKQQGIIQGTQPPVDGTFTQQQTQMQTDQPGGYQGPFKDAETDEYYKEADPEMWATTHRNFQMASNAAQRVGNLENEIRQMKTAPAQPSGPSEEEVHKVFDGKIKSWSGDHTDYFTAANIGDERLNSFKNFIIKNHAGKGLKIADLTPDFLQSEFARFDPKYNLAYMQQLATKKAKAAQNDSGMFAEGSAVRSKAVPLDEQQEHMADML
jgi:hypothetical protein